MEVVFLANRKARLGVAIRWITTWLTIILATVLLSFTWNQPYGKLAAIPLAIICTMLLFACLATAITASERLKKARLVVDDNWLRYKNGSRKFKFSLLEATLSQNAPARFQKEGDWILHSPGRKKFNLSRTLCFCPELIALLQQQLH